MWLSCPRSAYLVGICGSGMKALAEVLVDRDWHITGSDLHGDGPVGQTLRLKGAEVFGAHSAAQIPAGVDLLIYSSAVSPNNSERVWATMHGVPQLAYHEMLGELTQHAVGISIAGTHGKSTTTALTGTILTSAGLLPTVIVGAEVCGRKANGWSGNGPHLVVESCEYRRHFLSLWPQFATILGIEADHFDCFSGVDETANAFQEFVKLIPASGLVIIHRECLSSQFVIQAAGCEIETISMLPDLGEVAICSVAPHGNKQVTADVSVLNSDTCAQDAPIQATWSAVEIERTKHGHHFQIMHRGANFCSAHLNIPGRHHVLNTLAATALCFRAGATAKQIATGIAEFRGIRRRFEVLGEWRGVTIVDDYAHHPTAIRATLQTAKEQYAGRRTVCVFQPHQVSRTLGLLSEFAKSFSDADEVLVVPVFGARENFERELSDVSQRLADLIAAEGVPARFSARLDQTWTSLDDTLRPHDVLITLGAGDIDRIHSMLHGLR
jgi:UDP-N-acetylmuramate--alanine ligase